MGATSSSSYNLMLDDRETISLLPHTRDLVAAGIRKQTTDTDLRPGKAPTQQASHAQVVVKQESLNGQMVEGSDQKAVQQAKDSRIKAEKRHIQKSRPKAVISQLPVDGTRGTLVPDGFPLVKIQSGTQDPFFTPSHTLYHDTDDAQDSPTGIAKAIHRSQMLSLNQQQTDSAAWVQAFEKLEKIALDRRESAIRNFQDLAAPTYDKKQKISRSLTAVSESGANYDTASAKASLTIKPVSDITHCLPISEMAAPGFSASGTDSESIITSSVLQDTSKASNTSLKDVIARGRQARLNDLEALPIDQLWRGTPHAVREEIVACEGAAEDFAKDLKVWDSAGMRESNPGMEKQLPGFQAQLTGMVNSLQVRKSTAGAEVTAEMDALRAKLSS